MPIFRVKSVKMYTGQKNLHRYIRGIRDKYQVCVYARAHPLLAKMPPGPSVTKKCLWRFCFCSDVRWCLLYRSFIITKETGWEVRVEPKTCISIRGIPVPAILNHKHSTGLAGGAREGQNMAHGKYLIFFIFWTQPETRLFYPRRRILQAYLG